jgi:hypothetical protein
MRIIDAIWEKRNLGVSCKEIVIENSDSVQDVESVIANLLDIDYVVFKVQSGGIEYVKLLSEHGFYFIEALSEMSLDIDSYNIPKKLVRFDQNVKYHLFPSEKLNILGSELKKGIFTTDRIALDSRFGTDMAAYRYFNWIQDEVSKGNSIYEIVYKEMPIGFFAMKQIGENSFDNFLAGLYVNESNFGFGFSILSKSIEEVKKRNGKYLITHVSSNNLPVIRLYIQFGFSPNNIYYLMIKHFD